MARDSRTRLNPWSHASESRAAHLVAHVMGVLTAIQLTYDRPERVRTALQLAAGLLEVQPAGPPGLPAPARVRLAPSGRLAARNLL